MLPLPEARDLVLWKGLVALKARLVGVEDGQCLIGQHLGLLQLQDTGALGRGRQSGGRGRGGMAGHSPHPEGAART